MERRTFLKQLTAGAAASAAASLSAGPISGRIPLGLNTYCLRAMRWRDQQLMDYTAGLKMDAIFLQDSLDPQAQDPAHWRFVRDYAKKSGLHLETGGGGVLPKTRDAIEASALTIRRGIQRAAAMGSPIMRCVIASDRQSLPPGPVEQHMETMIKLLRSVRSETMDAGLKIAIEVHKDLQAWEHREVIEGAGKEFVGCYLDTGNPVFVLEHPLTTVEVLGPYAVTLHLRDSIVYEHGRGVAVQWVPLGEGVVDFREIIAKVREVCPPVHVYVKPITGRPPQVLPWLEPQFWARYPKARSADFARFLALAKSGHPYERPMVIEDLQGRPIPEHFLTAIQYQQREHMERSIAYAKNELDLGVRWRN